MSFLAYLCMGWILINIVEDRRGIILIVGCVDMWNQNTYYWWIEYVCTVWVNITNFYLFNYLVINVRRVRNVFGFHFSVLQERWTSHPKSIHIVVERWELHLHSTFRFSKFQQGNESSRSFTKVRFSLQSVVHWMNLGYMREGDVTIQQIETVDFNAILRCVARN